MQQILLSVKNIKFVITNKFLVQDCVNSMLLNLFQGIDSSTARLLKLTKIFR